MKTQTAGRTYRDGTEEDTHSVQRALSERPPGVGGGNACIQCLLSQAQVLRCVSMQQVHCIPAPTQPHPTHSAPTSCTARNRR